MVEYKKLSTSGIRNKMNEAQRNPQGLYHPRNEHDSCGIGFVANIDGQKNHQIIEQGLEILLNLTHRGAVGFDPNMGDGAGILLQIPDEFLRSAALEIGINLPPQNNYGVGNIFFPQNSAFRKSCEEIIEKHIREEEQIFLGWRDLPVSSEILSESVRKSEPYSRQIFVEMGPNCANQIEFERKLFIIRKLIENSIFQLGPDYSDFYICTLSSKVLNYKGMLLSRDVGPYFKDLSDKKLVSGLAMVHQRFSTNTFPKWSLAQPFRMICHNGEINTLRGNVNWMNARRKSLFSDIFGSDLDKIWPLIPEGQSDSAGFDNALELLTQGGYSVAHAMMMLIPEAWQGNTLMDKKRRAFYEYHSALMEPWDGPASIAFSDGVQIGATLDRNGLRPSRYLITEDGMVVLASEMGVLPIPENKITKKWRLQPGKMLLIDTKEGRIIDDEEIKSELSNSFPYQKILDKTQINLNSFSTNHSVTTKTIQSNLETQKAFGFTQEGIKFLIIPMANNGIEATGSMGSDTPIAVMSDRPTLLYNYFRQNFAQVTNPAIDPIRESLVMSLLSLIGPKPNLLQLPQSKEHNRLEVSQPILTNDDAENIINIEKLSNGKFRSVVIDITFPNDNKLGQMEKSLQKICDQASKCIRQDNYNIIILSDKNVSAKRIGIPALLATSAVHHHLIREGLRTSTGLVVQTGEAREIHHFCTLAGYGAEAINPYLVLNSIKDIVKNRLLDDDLNEDKALENFIKASGKGILKVMSKMGISTYQSYCGAQIFDAVGLKQTFVDKYFSGTGTTIEGIGINEVEQETYKRHNLAFNPHTHDFENMLDPGGEYQFRLKGERHYWNPQTVSTLQHAVRGNAQDRYESFSTEINDQSERLMTPRGLFVLNTMQQKIPLEKIESAEKIVERFSTGAMSFGSISREAHTTLAIAMNQIGGRSNTGEGGEESDRFTPMSDGRSMRSSIKQVASGRFGVTTEYLINSDMMQIKVAQGAKPGEGGQLPGHKVDKTIARVRYSTPGVGLISPPPHHDIYSIEDLAQLIFDLKNVNPAAQVSVKLVSEIGVGTVAAGVSKARADHVTIAGESGGTGASPQTSIKHAGSPWEIGLAETHQTLVLNRLRGRITVQVDGGLRTGRDVVIGALLGADEFGFSTAPLIAAGCIMMRKCHLNTCPVGIATQNPLLRKRFPGTPEHVINYFFFVAEEVRTLMSKLGFYKFEDMIGRSDVLDMTKGIEHFKAKGLDLTRLLHKPDMGPDVAISNTEQQHHEIENVLDKTFIKDAKDSINNSTPIQLEYQVTNRNRTIGAMLSGSIAKKYGHAGLPDGTIHIKLKGTAGQSFGAWVSRGVTLELSGDTNDYTGKGLSGGRLIVYPNSESKIIPEESMIVGNVVLYGAIAGECYFRGIAAERFAVRNSGAWAVVEGVGDHACEYMTGGVVVVIGPTGRNFAAGMSGGIAYVLDESGDFKLKVNQEMVVMKSIQDDRSDEERQMDNLDRTDISYVSREMLSNDASRLCLLLNNHYRYTGSAKSKKILENLDYYLSKFIKIVPVDYERALIEIQNESPDNINSVGI